VIKIEKRSFLLGGLISSVALLFQVSLLAFSIDFTTCAIVCTITPLLLFFVLYKIISRNWTNRLAYEMYEHSLQKKYSHA
jgi:hypothetical protein